MCLLRCWVRPEHGVDLKAVLLASSSAVSRAFPARFSNAVWPPQLPYVVCTVVSFALPSQSLGNGGSKGSPSPFNVRALSL